MWFSYGLVIFCSRNAAAGVLASLFSRMTLCGSLCPTEYLEELIDVAKEVWFSKLGNSS